MANKELKDRLAVPPIPYDRPRVRGARNRSRIRMEIGRAQAMVLMSLMSDKLKTLTVEDVEFRELYSVYSALKVQIEKLPASPLV